MIALTVDERMRWALAVHYFGMATDRPVSPDIRDMAAYLVEWAFESWDVPRVRRTYLERAADAVGPEL